MLELIILNAPNSFFCFVPQSKKLKVTINYQLPGNLLSHERIRKFYIVLLINWHSSTAQSQMPFMFFPALSFSYPLMRLRHETFRDGAPHPSDDPCPILETQNKQFQFWEKGDFMVNRDVSQTVLIWNSHWLFFRICLSVSVLEWNVS